MTRCRVLAIAPVHRGFGYAVFEDAATLLDWGVKEVKAPKNRGCLARAGALLQLFQPGLLVLEDAAAPGSRRRTRVRRLIGLLARRAGAVDVPVVLYARTTVHAALASGVRVSKHLVAERVAERVPALAPRLPRRRRLWESEPYAMAIFDAAALALAHYAGAQAQ